MYNPYHPSPTDSMSSVSNSPTTLSDQDPLFNGFDGNQPLNYPQLQSQYYNQAYTNWFFFRPFFPFYGPFFPFRFWWW